MAPLLDSTSASSVLDRPSCAAASSYRYQAWVCEQSTNRGYRLTRNVGQSDRGPGCSASSSGYTPCAPPVRGLAERYSLRRPVQRPGIGALLASRQCQLDRPRGSVSIASQKQNWVSQLLNWAPLPNQRCSVCMGSQSWRQLFITTVDQCGRKGALEIVGWRLGGDLPANTQRYRMKAALPGVSARRILAVAVADHRGMPQRRQLAHYRPGGWPRVR